MRKFFLALLCVAGMTSCSLFDSVKNWEEIDEGTDSEYAEYPGMNANTEPLRGTTFTLPAGIEMSEMCGQDDQRENELGFESLDNMYGSGLCVIASFTLTNTTSSAITVTFPAGLMVQAASSEDQNGILVKDVEIKVKGNNTQDVTMMFYCLNASSHGSSSESRFTIAGVTTIDAFDAIFDVCAGKKVNIEEYSKLTFLKYFGAVTTIQELVWGTTQGRTYTKEEVEKYLKKIK